MKKIRLRTSDPPHKRRNFTAFRSASEEAENVGAASEEWDNDGGHMNAQSGYIMRTPDAALTYKVVLDHEEGPDTEHPCGTIGECQALIRRNTHYSMSHDQGKFAL